MIKLRKLILDNRRRVFALAIIGAITVAVLTVAGLSARSGTSTSAHDGFINNPFSFTILKNYSCDFSSIGNVIDSQSLCPLEKENIANPSFCFIRVVKYEGLTVRVFSFDVLQSGTAEYVVSTDAVKLSNGLSVGSDEHEVMALMGKPYKVAGETYVWRSGDLHNYLAFTIRDGKVSGIRWHEEREPIYGTTVVWKTSY